MAIKMYREDRLESELRQQVPDLADWEWARLEEEGYVNDAVVTDEDAHFLAERIREWRSGGSPRSPRARTDLADRETLWRRAASRADALSLVLAADAAQQDGVRDFRRRVLRGKLVKPENVGQWIERRRGKATSIVTAPEGDPTRVLSHGRLLLKYTAPEARAAVAVPVELDSDLDHLRRLSESLSKHYGWQSAQATVFVLTNQVPLVSVVRARTSRRWSAAAASIAPDITAPSRIVLEIDPTTTPQEVEHAYKSVQKEMLGRRGRRQGDKMLRLAIFAYEQALEMGRGGEGSEPWGAWMKEWNRTHPDWRCSAQNTFRRDALEAVRRLLDPLRRPS